MSTRSFWRGDGIPLGVEDQDGRRVLYDDEADLVRALLEVLEDRRSFGITVGVIELHFSEGGKIAPKLEKSYKTRRSERVTVPPGARIPR